MARRTPDQGVRPFEVRTGVGGMPPLGGIQRAGDPATIPLHRHHLIVNGRITPEGLTERPGLAVVYNTNIEECITGITSTRQPGASILVFPGAKQGAGNGAGPTNAATLRSMFPGTSNVYSEYSFIVQGELSPVENFANPVVEFWNAPGTPPRPNVGLFPFLHDGTVHYWATSGAVWIPAPPAGDTAELWRAALPEPSGEQARDFYLWRGCAADETGTVPAPPSLICLPGQSWPRGHPWAPAEYVFTLEDPFGDGRSIRIEQTLSQSERQDEVLGGAVVVSGALYVLVSGISGTVRSTKLFRWDGLSLTEENVTIDTVDESSIPYYVHMVSLGTGSNLCVLLGGDTTAGGESYVRGEDGAWTTHGGVEDVADLIAFYPMYGFSWGGLAYFIGLSNDATLAAPGVTAPGTALIAVVFDTDHFEVAHDFSADFGAITVFVGATTKGPSVFIVVGGDGTAAVVPEWVFEWDVPSGNVSGTLELASFASLTSEARWIQNSGGTVYVGGRFFYDPILMADEIEGCHAIYDVTSIAAPGLMYRLYDTDAADYNYDITNLSYGALPVPPGSAGQSERDGSSD